MVSTSTRNFPNRLGDGANVFLASAEVAAIAATLGHIPTADEYSNYMSEINAMSADVYRYLNFHEIASYKEAAIQCGFTICYYRRSKNLIYLP